MAKLDFEFTALRGGYYRVYVNGVEVSKHLAEREALERAAEEITDDATALVEYDHDYRVRTTIKGVEPEPPPAPEPPPPPPPVEPTDPEYPNRPAHLAPLTANLFQSLPGPDGWWLSSGAENLALVDDAALGRKVLRVTWPEGLPDGNGPGLFGFTCPAQREVYVSYGFRIVGPDFEQQYTGTKLLGYLAYGKRDRMNQFFFHMMPNGADKGGTQGTDTERAPGLVMPGPFFLESRFTLEYGAPWPYPAPNQPDAAAGMFACDVRHQLEFYAKLNDDGQANGIHRLYLDGNLTTERRDIIMVNSAKGATEGFYQIRVAPVWGGSNKQRKARADHMHLDHIAAWGEAQG